MITIDKKRKPKKPCYLLALVAIFVATDVMADCTTDLIPTFESLQAETLCATFLGTATIGATLIPGVDNTYDLGSGSFQFNEAFFGGDITLSGAGDAYYSLGGTTINADASTVMGGAPGGLVVAVDANANEAMNLIAFGANANSNKINAIKTRSTGTDANTIISSGDDIFQIIAYGADGVDYKIAAFMTIESGGTPGAGDMPGQIVFGTTPDGSSSATAALTIQPDQDVVVTADVDLTTTGKTLLVETGTAASACAGTATANGTTAVVISTTCAATGAHIFISRNAAPSGTAQCWTDTIVNGTSFNLDCSGAETGTFEWWIIKESA